MPLPTILSFTGVILLALSVLFIFQRKKYYPPIPFTCTCILLFFLFGICTTALHNPTNQPRHYCNVLPLEEPTNPLVLQAKVVKNLGPSRYYQRYIVQLQKIGAKKTQGTILIQIPKDSTRQSLSIDQEIVFSSRLEAITPPRNPYGFNYKAYMKNKGVYLRTRLRAEDIIYLQHTKTSLRGYASKIRKKLLTALDPGLTHAQLAMVKALFLGQDQGISDAVYANYSAAGVIHILSVSGLHVGFILLIINFILSPLERLPYGQIIKMIICILFLWAFALLAGFSAPVVRSVSMFSLIAVGLCLKRKTNILNILFFSLFATLLIAPNFILDIGFQFSYLAVFSIALFYPFFRRKYKPRFFIGKFVWESLCLSFAAQIGVVPLSLYYFHQFPGLFFLANLIVVPYVGILLGYGLFVIGLGLFQLLPDFLLSFFGTALDGLNLIVAWFAEQKDFLFTNLHFSTAQMLSCYLFLSALVFIIRKYTPKKLIIGFTAFVFTLGVFSVEFYQKNKSTRLVVFEKTKQTIIGFQQGSRLDLFHSLKKENISQNYTIKNFLTGAAIARFHTDSLRNIYKVKAAYLLVVDSLAVYQIPEAKGGFLLLRNSPKVNLVRVINYLQPKIIIADGSNYDSYVHRWEATCKKKNTPFYDTGEKGAFQLKL